MVYRVFVEKKQGLDNEARGLLSEARNLLGLSKLENIRLFNRYDAENISRELFSDCVKTVFSEPQLDIAAEEIQVPGAYVFAVEALPGQFDQRADSAAQCIQIISQGDRPLIRTAKVYALYGPLTDGEIAAFKKYVINPVECREAALDKPETLAIQYDIPTDVATLTGFTRLDKAGLEDHCLLPAVFHFRGPGSHHHRDSDDRHLLVRPLPPHHLRHHHRRRGVCG